MDDLRLHYKIECELQSLVHTVQIISKDIGMEFGIGKFVISRIYRYAGWTLNEANGRK